MKMPDLLDPIVARINTLEGFAGASKVQTHIPGSPWVMVRQASEPPTRYVKARFGAQIVEAWVDAVILVPSSRDQPGDEAVLNDLPERILDAFDTSHTGGDVIELLPGFPEDGTVQIQRVWQDATVLRALVEWGPVFCYAAVVRMDARLERRPEAVTTKETP